MLLDAHQLKEMVSRKRATLINSLAGIKTAVLVGTKSESGHTNLAVFNSLVHIGANPPLYGLIFRPDTVERHTLKNIQETGYYTLNYLPFGFSKNVHQTAAKYPAETSEFDACGFTEHYYPEFPSPAVQEAVIRFCMKAESSMTIPLNGTILQIGSIMSIEMDETLLQDDGFVSLHTAGVLASAGLDAYYRTAFIHRLSYAQPDQQPTIIQE